MKGLGQPGNCTSGSYNSSWTGGTVDEYVVQNLDLGRAGTLMVGPGVSGESGGTCCLAAAGTVEEPWGPPEIP